MSIIPKVVLDEMIPPNALKLIENNTKISIDIINVLSPMNLDELGLDTIQIWFGNNQLPELLQKKIIIKFNEKSFSISNIKETKECALLVGDKFKLIIPVNDMNIKPGTYEVRILLKAETLIDFKFKRNIESLL